MTSRSSLQLLFASVAIVCAIVFVYVQTGMGFGIVASVFNGSGLLGGLSEAEREIQTTGIRSNTDLIQAIAEIVNFALTFVGIFAVVAFIVSGFIFILGFGSDSSIQRARKIMIWTSVGIVVIFFAFVIVNFIIDLAS